MLERETHDLAGQSVAGINDVNGLANGRVTEAERRLREFKRNGRIDATRVTDEFLDVRRNGAGVLIDRGMLIFHFDD